MEESKRLQLEEKLRELLMEEKQAKRKKRPIVERVPRVIRVKRRRKGAPEACIPS